MSKGMIYGSVILSELTEGTTINGISLAECTTEEAAANFLESISEHVSIKGTWDNENFRGD